MFNESHDQRCKTILERPNSDSPLINGIDSRMCFISGPNKSPDTLIDESGSPLFYKSNNRSYIHGILFAGSSKSTRPLIKVEINIFIKVGPYLDWIEEIVWPNDNFEMMYFNPYL